MILADTAGNLDRRALAIGLGFARRLDAVESSQTIHTLDLEAMKP